MTPAGEEGRQLGLRAVPSPRPQPGPCPHLWLPWLQECVCHCPCSAAGELTL